MSLFSKFLVLLLLLAAAAGGAYFRAGSAVGPTIAVNGPAQYVGRTAVLDFSVEAPEGALTSIEAVLAQGETVIPLFVLTDPGAATIEQETAERIRIVREFDRDTLPDVREGAAELIVTSVRPVLYGLREASSAVTHPLELRFTPPRLTVLSTQHYVNHGGAEMVVYRVTPTDVDSGVVVDGRYYPGFQADGAGVTGADESMRVAFFALQHDQELNAPMRVTARDPAGNTAGADFDHRIFPKNFRRSRINVGDDFIQRVVPAIAEQSSDARALLAGVPEDDLVAQYVAINGGLRQANADYLVTLAENTEPRILWQGPFRQLGNSQFESGFADHRIYLHDGEEIDRQVHLGFDLAATANVPILASNHGVVVHADFLGIYGNCVVIDHGMGLQSLYAHLSSIGVAVGDAVEQGQEVGRSGMTGLAGGDHLHFTMLLHGRAVTPVEWWDGHWIEDRIARKLALASAR
ncbi:MAG: M23 family metallopeptidase [Vicinamibacterales bacterium]|jgi:murein DD-endopeptidase MepM/ murein hydrolase activator NlpD|nr:hypothetical protein [Acidobacteriota bacterium]MDP7471900.1 M23 family metallopeptidase [Vicinamibacterales bacterium]MDP7672296.1 M23 family metallopeptidase [Vicinamibacterales bacterium]HJO37925.1 M23 family metallopeptidase [Vicinamibacterales bacterium]